MDIDTELRRLAERVDPPVVPAEDDLARGRSRVRRTRFAGSGAAVATAATIVGVALLTSPGTDPGTEGPTDPGPASSSTPAYTDRTLPLAEVPAEEGFVPDNAEALQAWRDVLAEHLDPRGRHLEKKPSNEQSGGGNVEGAVHLGTKLGWSVAGEDGLGLVQITVASHRGELYSECGQTPGWSCRDLTTPGGRPATVIDHDGVHEVVVEQADGEFVSIALDNLFGNNSALPVSDIPLTDEQLFAAAADQRIDLPADQDVEQDVEQPTSAIPLTRAETRALMVSLLGDGEQLGEVSGGGGRLRADVVRDGVRQGELWVEAWPALTSPTQCQADVYTACVERSFGDAKVFLGTIDPRANNGLGGWQVAYDGPLRRVQVSFTAAPGGGTVDRDRVAELVIGDRWQR